MIYGKLVAGAIGLLVFGWFGLLVGLLVGHSFDRGLQHTLGFASPARLAAIQDSFLETCFCLLGQVAKADGRVSEIEIAQAEHIMQQMGVNEQHREQAIGFFKRGAEADFQSEPLIARFHDVCHGQKQLERTLLVFLISMALADGSLDAGERSVLQTNAGYLGYSEAEFQRLLDMVQAQAHFHGDTAGESRAGLLADAYLALGVAPECTEGELKKAYRRQMSQYHPDKLIARGVPEDMIAIATEKTQEIQAAYELIKKQRKAAA